jgi:hypothetical protein
MGLDGFLHQKPGEALPKDAGAKADLKPPRPPSSPTGAPGADLPKGGEGAVREQRRHATCGVQGATRWPA